jgi:lipoprotein-releasing system permease protein
VSLARLIAWRYLKRPSDRLVTAVGIASLLGLVIGVTALVISMALMTGYRGDLEKKLLGGNAEVFVYSISGEIHDSKKTVEVIRTIPAVSEASPVLFQSALVSSEDHSTGEQVMLKGVEPGRSATSPLFARVFGDATVFRTAEGYPGVAIGKHLAAKLGAEAGSALTVTVPAQQNGSFLPNTSSYTVTNVFDTGFYEFDARWVFIDIAEARTLLNLENANLIEVKLKPGADLEGAVRAVAVRTGNQYAVTDWRQMNRQLFSLLRIQQLVLFIVIGLIVFVSTFNIVSTLIMTVHEKRREIGILVSMGADQRLLRRIFLWYGTLVGVGGTLLGIALGALASWILTRYELISFGPEIAEVYFVSSIPFKTRWTDLAAIAAFTILVSFLATVLPSMRAARLNPIDALRHE